MGADGESDPSGPDDLDTNASSNFIFFTSVPVKKRSITSISPKDFEREFIDKAVPLVLTDFMSDWPCADKWTLQWFAEKHGEVQVAVDDGTKEKMRCSLREFVDKCDEDDDAAESTMQASTSESTDALTAGHIYSQYTHVVPYLRTWNFLDDLPELEQDIRQNSEYFKDYFHSLKESWRPPFTWAFLGGKGVRTPLHVDIWHTDAWLTSLEGEKKFVLFHPGQVKYIFCDDDKTFVDLENVDYEKFPNFQKATPVEVHLKQGETIYIPRKWPHYAVCVEPGVSLTVNFLSRANRRNVVEKTIGFANRRDACEMLIGRKLRASDNLLKFCVHGGNMQLGDAAKIMGVDTSTLQEKMKQAKRDRLRAEQEEAERDEEE